MIAASAGADHRALEWHAYLWDPWFLVRGLLVVAALLRVAASAWVLSGLIKFLAPEQCVKADPVTRQGAGASFLPVDDAQRVADPGTQLTELAGGDRNLPARGHHVLDDQDPAAPDLGALGQPDRTVSLGRLPHERARQASSLPERRDHRDAAHLQARQHLGPLRNQRHHRIGQLAQQDRIGLEPVLVEVLIDHPGPSAA